jgi:hypothetical protein
VQASTSNYDGKQHVYTNPGSRKRKITNFLLVAWCELQGSSYIIQDASAVVLDSLIGLCKRVDLAGLMCSLRPARSAWLVAWPMQLRTNTIFTKSGRGVRTSGRMITKLSRSLQLNFARAGLALSGSIMDFLWRATLSMFNMHMRGTFRAVISHTGSLCSPPATSALAG